jgi:DNA (cytosine-5)-methyltransferase 1
MNELALFAGAGGGILGGKLLGWRTVCAVEWEPYPASVLCARQNDGLLPPFPIWDDIQTFDGRPWQGIVDVVSGGFPCQDISVAGGGGLESMESEAECGERWRGSFAKYDLDTFSWKTHQCSLLGGLDEFLETWPQWGLMRGGECWEQEMLVQTTKGTGFGLLPTPCARDGRGARSLKAQQKAGRGATNSLPDYLRIRKNWQYPPIVVVEYMMGWPLGWTDLKQGATDKSHYAPQPLGKS